jgi:DNA adenine methylase
MACGKLMRDSDVELSDADFENALKGTKKGDLVFLDPPYVTAHNNNGFIDYNEKLFSWRDQGRLARVAVQLSRRGVHVLVANANHDDVLQLYPGFNHIVVTRSSTLGGANVARRRVTEAILTNGITTPGPPSR